MNFKRESIKGNSYYDGIDEAFIKNIEYSEAENIVGKISCDDMFNWNMNFKVGR